MSEVRVLEELEREGWIWVRNYPIRDSEEREHLLSYGDLSRKCEEIYGGGHFRLERAFDRAGNALAREKWVAVYVKK